MNEKCESCETMVPSEELMTVYASLHAWSECKECYAEHLVANEEARKFDEHIKGLEAKIPRVGSLVEKVGGDYTFVGTVVAKFKKLSGMIRYVVEDDRGVLHVYSDKNLKVRT